MKRLENPTSDYPRIHSSTLYSSGVFNILLATLTSTLSVMVLEESVHAVKPNTTQIPFRQRKGYSTISYRIHGYDNEKDSIIRLCIHHPLISLLGQESLTLYIFEDYTRTLRT